MYKTRMTPWLGVILEVCYVSKEKITLRLRPSRIPLPFFVFL